MMKEVNKIEKDFFNAEVDKLEEEGLSLFQIAILKDVYYFTEKYGVYKYLKMYVANKYKAIDTPTNLHKEVEALIKDGYLTKTIKKTITDGRFSTIIYYKLN